MRRVLRTLKGNKMIADLHAATFPAREELNRKVRFFDFTAHSCERSELLCNVSEKIRLIVQPDGDPGLTLPYPNTFIPQKLYTPAARIPSKNAGRLPRVVNSPRLRSRARLGTLRGFLQTFVKQRNRNGVTGTRPGFPSNLQKRRSQRFSSGHQKPSAAVAANRPGWPLPNKSCRENSPRDFVSTFLSKAAVPRSYGGCCSKYMPE